MALLAELGEWVGRCWSGPFGATFFAWRSDTPFGVRAVLGRGPGVSQAQPPANVWQPSGLAGLAEPKGWPRSGRYDPQAGKGQPLPEDADPDGA